MNLPDSAQDQRLYAFLDFTLDGAAERLVRGTVDVKLRRKSFQVLRYLVEHPGRLITREELLQAVWRHVAVTDDSVTKCIADIRQALGDVSQEIIRTVGGRGYLFQVEVCVIPSASGSPLQVPTANENPSLSAAQGLSITPARPLSDTRAMLVGIVAVAFVAGFLLLHWRGQVFGRKPTFEAIAVLPFENLSSDPGQQYVADGLTEALITNLGQASDLRVIARTSVGQYKGTKKPVREIARELNVDSMVEGTVTQFDDRLRVTANLIQVSPEKHLWARAYERNSRDVLELQNEIAGAIALEIQGKLTPAQQARMGRSRPVNPEAQLAYWKARYFLNALRDPEATRKSIEYSEQAVLLEPEFAAAHATLATSYAMLSGGNTIPPDAVTRAKSAAHRAIALDDKLADAYVGLGSVLLLYDWDWLEQSVNSSARST